MLLLPRPHPRNVFNEQTQISSVKPSFLTEKNLYYYLSEIHLWFARSNRSTRISLPARFGVNILHINSDMLCKYFLTKITILYMA